VSTSDSIEVVLVEDNQGDITLFREALKHCLHRVALTVASDGEQALELLHNRQIQPDLIILDLHIPKLDGISILEKYHPKRAPVVVFSSTCTTTSAKKALELGADECIEKPLGFTDFMNTVADMIEKWTRPKAKS
jgi:CheY-like chemotaxis protein